MTHAVEIKETFPKRAERKRKLKPLKHDECYKPEQWERRMERQREREEGRKERKVRSLEMKNLRMTLQQENKKGYVDEQMLKI
ncbi:hypothetical protein M8J76_006489 [Diaphorina citri]|nr:hypothetical protein M8J76_006489 [Diaphorina citri]